MPLTIWKAPLAITDQQALLVPKGADFLSVQEQDGQLAAWFRCDPNAEREPRIILIYGTGHPTVLSAQRARYLGTSVGATLVWHVFEKLD